MEERERDWKKERGLKYSIVYRQLNAFLLNSWKSFALPIGSIYHFEFHFDLLNFGPRSVSQFPGVSSLSLRQNLDPKQSSRPLEPDGIGTNPVSVSLPFLDLFQGYTFC